MKPPPPMPHDCGRATPSAKTVEAAASIALPPCSSTSRPPAAAAGGSVATTPYGLVTPGWKREPSLAVDVVGTRARAPHRTAARTVHRMPDRYPFRRLLSPRTSGCERLGRRLLGVLGGHRRRPQHDRGH